MYPAIRVSNLGKEYTIGGQEQVGQSFREMLTSCLAAPFMRLRNLGVDVVSEERFWALKDVSCEVQQGEVVGIIGRNGAGKSTLLKILSRITDPTQGEVLIRGRVASLLEVGTGFHPELTGRENIYLNGAILGMRHVEIEHKFDEIVAFAEVEKFIDTPVKRYSSGMYVRLAFAVAAHLETDILFVDEILAVGDAAFQRKCLGKMSDAASGGKTVLFVSHNLAAIRNLCTHALLFDRGVLVFDGAVLAGLKQYEASFGGLAGLQLNACFHGALAKQISFTALICLQDDHEVETLDPMRPLRIEVHGTSAQGFAFLDIKLGFFRDGVFLSSCHDSLTEIGIKEGPFVSRFDIPGDIFRPGRYTVGIGAVAAMGSWIWGSDVGMLNFSENVGGRPLEFSEGLIAIPYLGRRFQ